MTVQMLIAGCGDLGTEIGLRVAATGHGVVGIRRRAELLPPQITGLAADLSEPLPPLPSTTQVLVYAAAADARRDDAYHRAYVAGPQRVLDALDRAGAPLRRTILVSSTAVYGVDDGSDVDESTPTEPSSSTGRILLDGEVALRDRLGAALTVVRLAGVYGPGRTRLIDQVRAGSAVAPDPPVLSNRIHRDDAAQAIVHLLTSVDEPAPVYLGVDDAPVDRGEVLRFLAAELGMPPPPVGPDQRGRGGNKRCRNARLRATGWRPAYPSYVEGYRAILDGRGQRHD